MNHDMQAEADLVEAQLKKLKTPAARRKRILRPRRVVV
jgi:hypothetical protein